LDSGVAKADATRSSNAGRRSTSKVRKAKAKEKRSTEELKRRVGSDSDLRKRTGAALSQAEHERNERNRFESFLRRKTGAAVSPTEKATGK
jgi:hypothetical protein